MYDGSTQCWCDLLKDTDPMAKPSLWRVIAPQYYSACPPTLGALALTEDIPVWVRAMEPESI